MMQVICAWCERVLGTKAGTSGTTHTICRDCERKHFPQEAEGTVQALTS